MVVVARDFKRDIDECNRQIATAGHEGKVKASLRDLGHGYPQPVMLYDPGKRGSKTVAISYAAGFSIVHEIYVPQFEERGLYERSVKRDTTPDDPNKVLPGSARREPAPT